MVKPIVSFAFLLLVLTGCQQTTKPQESNEVTTETVSDSSTTSDEKPVVEEEVLPTVTQIDSVIDDTSFINLALLDSSIKLQFHYADTTNFLKTKVYPCATCFLRYEVAKALVKVNTALKAEGLQLVFFDCYRPRDVQKLMWEVVPDARYVANPYKGSSKHNRGGAVDLTLADADGNLLDMGTGFDHFGKEAHHDYKELPEQVLQNRVILKEAMALEGFSPIATEWWHYNYKNSADYAVSNQALPCP